MPRRRRQGGGDPYWLNLKFAGTCKKCGAKLAKGARAFYFPNGKYVVGSDCCGAAEKAAGDFNASAFDDAMMSGSW